MSTSHRKDPDELSFQPVVSPEPEPVPPPLVPLVPRAAAPAAAPRETGGRDGPEPTRFGDWEKNGRCIDF
jgi:hypothetical protein